MLLHYDSAFVFGSDVFLHYSASLQFINSVTILGHNSIINKHLNPKNTFDVHRVMLHVVTLWISLCFWLRCTFTLQCQLTIYKLCYHSGTQQHNQQTSQP